MTVASLVSLRDSWMEILNERFKLEIAQDRHEALLNALSRYAESLSKTPDELLHCAKYRLLSSSQWAHIVHIATNHETRFYRNPNVVDLVAEYAKHFPSPRLLSVGCSTGEEPYSFAVELLQQEIRSFCIHGTDVSQLCIETAENGVYRNSNIIPDRFVYRENDGHMHFYEWVKTLVTFEQHNVVSDRPIDFRRPDIIVTQNMLIYYRRETRHRILENLSLMLEPGGYLICGPTEEATWKPCDMERMPVTAATVFRKG